MVEKYGPEKPFLEWNREELIECDGKTQLAIHNINKDISVRSMRFEQSGVPTDPEWLHSAIKARAQYVARTNAMQFRLRELNQLKKLQNIESQGDKDYWKQFMLVAEESLDEVTFKDFQKEAMRRTRLARKKP